MSVDPLAGPLPTPPTSRNRWVHKLGSHFGNRNRNISEFYVQPDDPWRTYFPGDVIKGMVVLTVVKPVRVTHLVVGLHGFVKVFKNTVAPGEAGLDTGFLGPGRGRRGGQYFGNGFATLFEDELVLCGEGRLKEGIYKFQFDLELPPYSLPSSISFERGTISYVISSTLTRPNTISPTVSCHRRITVLEDLDIAPFPAPKPRVVSLEPVRKKSKSKSKQKSSSGDQIQDSPVESSLNGILGNDQRPPLSPAPSDISGSSRLSTSSQSFQIVADPTSTRTASVRSSEARSTTTSLAEKTITATAELQRAGGLPGDTIPIKVTIHHNRHLRSPHGIIITLYRQGRIDMHPAIPVGSPDTDGKQVYEDCLPKSRTGLSGLSFGTSRSSSVFRKDLSQTFTPLIVDPVTMTATVKTSIRIPEDAFPTISLVPGGMISFRYYVEVVADLRGKLAAQDRYLPRLNMVSAGSNFSSSGHIFTIADKTANSITSNWAGNILDTDQIRREKGVVAVMFELVVGTRDSNRRIRQAADENASLADNTTSFPAAGVDGGDRHSDGHLDVTEEQYANGEYYDDEYYTHDEAYWNEYPGPEEQPYQSLGEVLQPPPQPEEPADEKTRLRQAEEMLLPSRPPGQENAGPSMTTTSDPTAPDLPEDDHPYYYHPSPSRNEAGPSVPPPALSVETIAPGFNSGLDRPHDQESHGEDKQELERRRLMMEASAPEPAPCPRTQTGSAANTVTTTAATAPVLDEEDQIINLGQGDEALPRYQR